VLKIDQQSNETRCALKTLQKYMMFSTLADPAAWARACDLRKVCRQEKAVMKKNLYKTVLKIDCGQNVAGGMEIQSANSNSS
tara:strand:- start:3128 stop:3373 length:246 start_codon:yes stop_codon:yes gene_type:complete